MIAELFATEISLHDEKPPKVERFRSDAFAYATPFDDAHTCVHVFSGRVMAAVPRKLSSALLGHVMAHEITHVLERRDQHSATGVMKANWTANDYEAMAVHPLSFEVDNVEAIREYWRGGQ